MRSVITSLLKSFTINAVRIFSSHNPVCQEFLFHYSVAYNFRSTAGICTCFSEKACKKDECYEPISARLNPSFVAAIANGRSTLEEFSDSGDDVATGGDLSEALTADDLAGRRTAEAGGETLMTHAGALADESKDDMERSERGLLVNELKFTRTVVGKICDSKVIGDPHFTGADGSHFDFSGTVWS